MAIKVKLESVTFGDCSKKVVLPQNIMDAYENDSEAIINFVLNKCKSFRKYGKHLNEEFIMHIYVD